MGLQYGLNFTASDMRRLLEQNDRQQSGVRTWRQLFGNAALGYNAQASSLAGDYGDAITQAYKSNFAQKNAILGTGLNAGATRELLNQSQNDLHAAYQTYVQNYGKDLNTLTNDYLKETSAINTALTERASNFANLYSSAYKYLANELYGSTMTNNGNTLNYMTENNLGWLTNDKGELLSWDEISPKLVDKDRALTREGVMFFDQLFNATPQKYMTIKGENARTFDKWLSMQEDTFDNYDATNLPGMAKNGRELRDWWVSPDAFNYNFEGTNVGTSRVLSGRESTDKVFAPYEYVLPYDMNAYNFADFKGWSDAVDKYEALNSSSEFDTWKAAEEKMRKEAATWGTAHAESNPDYVRAKQKWNDHQVNLNVTLDNISKEWSTQTKGLSTNYDNLLSTMKSKLGSAKYNEFIHRYSKELSDFEAKLKETTDSEYGDRKILAELRRYYEIVANLAKSYVSTNQYTGKISGF